MFTCHWSVIFGMKRLGKQETVQGNETEKLRIWTQTLLNLFTLSCCSSLDQQVKDGDVKVMHPGPYGVSGEGAGRTPVERPPLDPGSAPSSSGSSSSPAGRWRPRAGSASGRCGWGCSHRGHGPGGFSTHRTKTKCVIEIHILLFTKILMVRHLKQPRLECCGVLSYPRIQQTCRRVPLIVRVQVGCVEGFLGAVFIGIGIRVTSRLHLQLRWWGGVSEADHFVHGDAVSSVEVHQTVQGAESLFPDAVLAAPLQHPEMFHPVAVAAKRKWQCDMWVIPHSSGGLRTVTDAQNVRACLKNHHRRYGDKWQWDIYTRLKLVWAVLDWQICLYSFRFTPFF